jgi:hypothetical protein
MAKEGKTDDEKVESKDASERQLRTRAKKALKKADRFWRLTQGVPSEIFKEQRMKQARNASEAAAEATRQANEVRAKAHEKTD